jgi:hypothetical protein
MSENLIADVKAGYDANQSMVDDRQSRQSLKDAYAQTESTVGENGVAAKDMFKVNSLAAQMAAQSGNLKAAERFDKQAQDSQQGAIQNQLNELKVQQSKFATAEKHIQMMNKPSDVIDILNSTKDIDPVLKMKLSAQVLELGDDPAAFKQWKENLDQGMMDAKDKVTAQERMLRDKQNYEYKMEMLDLKRSQERQTAGLANLTYGLRKDGLDQAAQKHYDDMDLKYDDKIRETKIKLAEIRTKINTAKNKGEGDGGLAKDEAELTREISRLQDKQDSLIDPRTKKSRKEADDNNEPKDEEAIIKQAAGKDYDPKKYEYKVINGEVKKRPRK